MIADLDAGASARHQSSRARPTRHINDDQRDVAQRDRPREPADHLLARLAWRRFLRFEWDDEKAASNLVKHGVSFDEAETVFVDSLAGIAPDPDHSERERREIIAGLSAAGRLLLVSFTERRGAIRIISARALTPSERRLYEEEDFP